MLIDKNSTFGENLSLASSGVIGDALDLGAAYNIGSGANRPPVLHIVSVAAVGSGELQLCTSENGIAAGDVLMSIPFEATDAEEVLYSGDMPTIPKASGRYLVLKNASSNTGSINAYVLNNAPNHHIYKAK